MALLDQAGKKTLDEAVAQVPGLEAFVDAQLSKLQDTLETVVGDALKDLTAERTEAVNQFGEVLHGVLDRLNGVTLTLGAASVTLKMPPKPEPPA